MRRTFGVGSNKPPLEHVRLGGISGIASESSLQSSSSAGGSGSSSVDIDDTIIPSNARIGDLFFDQITAICGDDEPGGVIQAMYRTLAAIENARRISNRRDETLRTMVISPGVDMRQGKSMFERLGFEVLRHRTSGKVRGPETRKRMNSRMNTFTADDGKGKLLFVRDASFWNAEDSITGLDIKGLDCVVSIGSGNLAQRISRLCRLSRLLLPGRGKHVLYVEIVPR